MIKVARQHYSTALESAKNTWFKKTLSLHNMYHLSSCKRKLWIIQTCVNKLFGNPSTLSHKADMFQFTNRNYLLLYLEPVPEREQVMERHFSD